MNHAALRERAADRRCHRNGHHFVAELQRVLQFGEIHGSARNKLAVDGRLRFSGTLKPADLPRRFHLLHCIVPLLVSLLLRLIGFFGRHVLYCIFLSFGVAGVTNWESCPEPGVTLVCNVKCLPSANTNSSKPTSTLRTGVKSALSAARVRLPPESASIFVTLPITLEPTGTTT